MKFAVLILLTIVALLGAPIVAAEFPNSVLRPNVLFVPLLVALLRCPGPVAVAWGGLIGLFCDCLLGPCLGPRMAIFSLLASAATLSLPDRPLSAIETLLFPFGFTFAAETFSSVAGMSLDGGTVDPRHAAAHAAGSALATALLVSVAWIVARQLNRLVRHRLSPGPRMVSIGWQRSAD